MMWIFTAVLSAVFAGLTSILAKCGVRKTDSDAATAIKLIYDMYLDGCSLRIIADELFSRGIKSPSGKDRWSAQYIDNVLSSKTYVYLNSVCIH